MLVPLHLQVGHPDESSTYPAAQLVEHVTFAHGCKQRLPPQDERQQMVPGLDEHCVFVLTFVRTNSKPNALVGAWASNWKFFSKKPQRRQTMLQLAVQSWTSWRMNQFLDRRKSFFSNAFAHDLNQCAVSCKWMILKSELFDMLTDWRRLCGDWRRCCNHCEMQQEKQKQSEWETEKKVQRDYEKKYINPEKIWEKH